MYLENNQIRRYPIRSILAWAAVVLWMVVIFLFSNQSSDDSGQLSYGIAEKLILLINSQASREVVSQAEASLRILAHGCSFFILAILISWSFTEIAVEDIRNALLTFVISALYAASDEIHQSFVPGRASQWSDFFIDAAGIILAILIYQLISTLRFIRADLRVKREEDLRIKS